MDVFAGEDFAEGRSGCSVGVGSCGSVLFLSSEEEEGGRRRVGGLLRLSAPALLCNERKPPRIW